MSTDTPPMTDTTNEPDWLDKTIDTIAFAYVAAVRTVKSKYPDMSAEEQVATVNTLVDEVKRRTKAAIRSHLLAAVEAELDKLLGEIDDLPVVKGNLIAYEEIEGTIKQRLAVLVTGENNKETL